MLTGGSAHEEELFDEEYEEADFDDWPTGKAHHRQRSTFLDRAALMARLDLHSEPFQDAEFCGIGRQPFLEEGRSNARMSAPQWARSYDAPGRADLHRGDHIDMPSHSRPLQSRSRNRNAARQPKHTLSTMDMKVGTLSCIAQESLQFHTTITQD
jgi:hypothetical protein